MARPSSTSISASATPRHARRERDDLPAHVPAGDQRRRAGIDRLPARESADALRDRRRIADRHDDVLDAAADLVGDDLRQRRAGALPLRGGAGRDRDLAVRQHPHRHALERSEPGAFHVIADADAEIAALFARVRLSRAEAAVTESSTRARLALGKIAARIDQRLAVAEHQPDRIGHLLGPDHVAGATSARSSLSSRATRSISRSMANTACGRPAPRTTVVGTRLVSTTVSSIL